MSNKNETFVFPLIMSIMFILIGGAMILKGMVGIGVNSRTKMVSGYGGHLLILAGIIFLVVTYYSISPFSKFRNLGKMFTKRRKHPKL
ncbi:hypothetical protein [Lunatibacter salilacus]|uniref:hypothetical protein n=1 Tax=Lunatibacter salilacus TaxID=2483804 RepID=UPI00131C776A|nr:hypothetical protein [Lunatibacter salilacus]